MNWRPKLWAKMQSEAAKLNTSSEWSRLRQMFSRSFDQKGSSDFDLNSDNPPANVTYRSAAVLIPIVARGRGLEVILTKRAAHLKHHPGQVSFPGGKVELSDKSAEAAAIREAWEEIGVMQEQVQILGRLPNHKTVTGFQVQPFVAAISADFQPHSDPNEVEEVFSVPLSHILNAENYLVQGRKWMGHQRWYYTVPYGPHYIWGATARMLRLFADRYEQAHES